jgi:hypothetical protein
MEKEEDRTEGETSTKQRSKKISWHQQTVHSNLQSRLQYVDACANWLVRQMGTNKAISPFKPNGIRIPSPKISQVKYRSNGFPSFKTDASEPKSVGEDTNRIVLANPGLQYLFPHDNIDMECAFCNESISTLSVSNGLYEIEWPSPWFFCCSKCAPKDT